MIMIVACDEKVGPISPAPPPDGAEAIATGIEDTPGPETGRLDRIVFVTTGKGCKCTMARCARGEEELKEALAGYPDAGGFERLDLSVDTNKAVSLMSKYPATILPIIYFLNSDGALLWKVEGDFDRIDVIAALKRYSASAE